MLEIETSNCSETQVFRLPELLASYGRFHCDPRNRMTHYFGVPLIVYALLVAAALPAIEFGGMRVPLERVLLGLLVLWYLVLDLRLGFVLALVLAGLAWAAEAALGASPGLALPIAGGVFVLGWVLQLAGHHLEGNRPALVTNLGQIFVAPIYLTAELTFALGLRAPLAAAVRECQQVLLRAGGTGSRPPHPAPAGPRPGRSGS